ncbi:sulfotransferase family 2 domain-containing protein [Bacillus sp. V5-8f]|uniref:sulfotransferase family 2 domain-containing protein n=1 Tax=Bacillus sp. V5-8f TaxID=2053044 RepID=UPI0015E088D8|nr:sulfotransferase family 2 domain-containing protein [Bacillus sp. V5-8f]
MNEKKVAIFLHIPKSAGSTLRSILKKNYDSQELRIGNREEMIESLKNLSKEEMEKIKCINGHVLFGIHDYLNERPYNYYTMLRDPIEHVISEYYFIVRKPNNISYEKVKSMSFEEFVLSEEFTGRTSNRQTFFISGGAKDAIEIAKENLKNYFSIVGITEMFDESIYLFAKELGWEDYYYKKKNVTKSRPSREDFPAHLIEIIKKNNELDIELYNYGKQLLEEKIENLGNKKRGKMEQFIQKQDRINKSTKN